MGCVAEKRDEFGVGGMLVRMGGSGQEAGGDGEREEHERVV